MKRKLNEKGITLLALVVTIIVLLILAVVAINLSLGNNGLFTRAERASDVTSKAQLGEDIKFKIVEAQIDKGGETLTRQDVLTAVERIEGISAELNGDIIEGEYKDYFFEIDENNEVIIGDKLNGEKPDGKAEVITEGEELEEVEIRVTASIKEGRIVSIESKEGAEVVEGTENKETEKIFKVKSCGIYRFKIKADNGRSAVVSCEVTNVVAFSVEEDIFTAIRKMETGGRKNIQVTGKKSDGTESTEIYCMNVIVYKGDMTLDGINMYEGSSFSEDTQTYEFGNAEKDVATGIEEDKMAKNTVVLKVDGNLTIYENITLTSVKSEKSFGGSKGMIIYCTGNITNNGTVSMTARGAYAKGQDVYLVKNIDGSFEYIPEAGGAGGVAKSATYSINGTTGDAPTTLLRLWWWWQSVDMELIIQSEELVETDGYGTSWCGGRRRWQW